VTIANRMRGGGGGLDARLQYAVLRRGEKNGRNMSGMQRH
jgi:hypothetical protein